MRSCRPSWSESLPTRSHPLPELRPITTKDAPALLDVFYRAMEDLDKRMGRSAQPRNPAPLEQHFRHLVGTDPASSFVADDHGRVVAFGIAVVRGGDGFLSFLFVAPEWQGRGIGRAVLAECLGGLRGLRRMATCAEANQPVSTGLYTSLGMAPRLPIYVVRGALPEGALPELPQGMRVHDITPERVATLDEELVGYQRPVDHEFWSANDRRGYMFLDPSGELSGYGYAQPSGRVGPVAARDPADLLSFIGYLVRSTHVLEGWQFVIPGPAITALRALLAAGLRIDGVPAVYCADHPGPRFDRYLPMSFALL